MLNLQSLAKYYDLFEKSEGYFEKDASEFNPPPVNVREIFDSVRKPKIAENDGVEMYECNLKINFKNEFVINNGPIKTIAHSCNGYSWIERIN